LGKRLGDQLSPAVKYWVFLVGIIGAIFAVIFSSFTASYLSLDPSDRATVAGIKSSPKAPFYTHIKFDPAIFTLDALARSGK